MATRRAKGRRGVALLMVVVAIAILTAVATEFAYNTRVDLELAANQRDEMRAEYLAKSGIALSRIVLHFQKQVDSIQMPNIGDLLSKITGGSSAAATGTGAPGAGAAATTPGLSGSLNLQIWKMAHVDCHMLQGLVPKLGPETGLSAGTGTRSTSKSRLAPVVSKPTPGSKVDPEAPVQNVSFGGFSGCFTARIEDEEEKLNVNQLDAPAITAQAAARRMLALFGDKRFEFLFQREDSNHMKVSPQDTMLAMRDWVDEDLTQSALNLSGTGDAFQNGFQDEASSYDRYVPRYKPKNGHLDTVEELYLVHGVNDAFMAAFRDRLTVYPDINTPLNINADDPVLLYIAILSVTDPVRPDGRLKDPLFIDSIIKRIRAARVMSMFGMSVADFVTIVQASGVAINTSILNSRQQNRWVSDKSQTFSIKATGEAGSVQRTITAVVRLDDQLGRLMYWREE